MLETPLLEKFFGRHTRLSYRYEDDCPSAAARRPAPDIEPVPQPVDPPNQRIRLSEISVCDGEMPESDEYYPVHHWRVLGKVIYGGKSYQGAPLSVPTKGVSHDASYWHPAFVGRHYRVRVLEYPVRSSGSAATAAVS